MNIRRYENIAECLVQPCRRCNVGMCHIRKEDCADAIKHIKGHRNAENHYRANGKNFSNHIITRVMTRSGGGINFSV